MSGPYCFDEQCERASGHRGKHGALRAHPSDRSWSTWVWWDAARAAASPVPTCGLCGRQHPRLGRNETCPPPDPVAGLREAVIAAGPPPDALMDGTPAGQALRDWWLDKYAPVLAMARDAALLAEPVPRPYPEPAIGYEAFERMIAEGKAEPVPLDGDVAAIVELARTYRPSKVPIWQRVIWRLLLRLALIASERKP